MWQGVCVAGGVRGGGHAWQGCVCGGGMHGRGHAWCGACMTGKTAIAAGGTHATGMHSCCDCDCMEIIFLCSSN